MQWRKIGTLGTSQVRGTLRNWLIRSTLISLSTWIGGPTPAAAGSTGNQTFAPATVYVCNDGASTEMDPMYKFIVATVPFPDSANGLILMPNGMRNYATNRNIGK